jgi:UMF1 family MFS transporter
MQTASSKKVINGWAMYDWANSAYNLVITSTIFPAYYETVTGDDIDSTLADNVHFLGRDFVNTSLYNYTLALAFLLVAAFSPLLSSIADYKGNKKSFLFFFCTMGSIACGLLYFFTGKETLWVGMFGILIACLGYWASLVFYNSYLPEIAPIEDRDKVSAKGFAMGYIGSMILQIICFVFVLKPELFGITVGMASRVSFILVGIWWWGFANLSLKKLPRGTAAVTGPTRNILTGGYKELQKVWQQLRNLPVLKWFLSSFFFYNMGVQTIMLIATLYGKTELGIPTTNLIIAILLIQLIAIPGAYTISYLSSKIGNLQALMTVVVLWIGFCYMGYKIPHGDVNAFYGLASCVGFVMGGIQSLSRSTYSKLMPVTKDTTSFFSFYDVTEKLASVIGLLSFGYIIEISGSQRNSVLVLMIFFAIGLTLLAITLTKERRHGLVPA